MKASKTGLENSIPVVAMFPDRLPCFEDTVKWVKEGHKLAGYNKNGVRTLLFEQCQIQVGMILANKTRGLRSTRIVKFVR
jgi:hypothetical protein